MWLTGKKRRINRLQRHRDSDRCHVLDPVSRKRNFRARGVGVNVGVPGSFLQAKFMKTLQSKMGSGRDGAAAASGRGGACTQDLNLVGWDDVLCRPIFYKNGSMTDTSTSTDTSSCASLEQCSFPELSPSSSHQEKTENEPDSDENDDEKENCQEHVGEIPWNGDKSNTSIMKNGKKQPSYGGQKQKRRGRQLSNMANSVLEQFSSPLQERCQSYNYNTKSKSKRLESIGFGDRDRDVVVIGVGVGVKGPSKLAFRDNYTPPRNAASSVCLDSTIRTSSCAKDFVTHVGKLKETNTNACSPISKLLQGDDDTDVDEDEDAGPSLQEPKSRSENHKRKSTTQRVCSKQKIAIKRKMNLCRNNGNSVTKRVSQPTYSTSLSEARAFFEHLDATHVLKIE